LKNLIFLHLSAIHNKEASHAHLQVKTAGASGWFNVQSYFAPTAIEMSKEQTGSSYGSLDKTATANNDPQPEVDEWHWDHENMLDDEEHETKGSKTEDDDGWDDGEWGEAGSWSNESWSNSTKNSAKVNRTSKKGD